MSRRRIALFEGSTHTVKVHIDTEWDEFRVTLFNDTTKELVSTYHSDDKDDAISTAQSILKHAEEDAAAEAARRVTVTATVRKQDLEDVLHAATELLAKYTEQITGGNLSAEDVIATTHIRNELFWAKQRVKEAAFGE